MLKNYVFCYIILIKLNKIFKIIFQIFLLAVVIFPPHKICKIVTFWGENDKGYYGNLFLYKYIGFNFWGWSPRKTEWVSNPSLFSNIVCAIEDCGLRDSLTTLNVYACELDKSKVQQMFNLKSMSHVNVIEEYVQYPLTK